MKNIEFHYTNKDMVKNLVKFIPLKNGDTVLDAGSGKNKVWINAIPNEHIKYECELEDGCDFLEWSKKVNWIIGNPPFDIGWKFIEKSIEIAETGIAVLGSIKFFNQFTSLRLEKMKKKGFKLQHIRIVADRRWFGRYYFLIFEKKNNNLISWDRNNY